MVNPERTKGFISLEKLQNNEFKLWTVGEIKKLGLGKRTVKVPLYIADQNKIKEIPSRKEISKKFKFSDGYRGFFKLEKRGIIISFTIPDLTVFYELDQKKYPFVLPDNLSWLEDHLSNQRKYYGSRTKSRVRKKENPGASRYPRHYVANIKDENGLPCYLPLNLHIKNK